MKYAGVIVLYNPTNEIVDNIKSYIDEIDILYAVDNSNMDNSELVSFNSKIKYIPNYKNLGIATALNIAAKNAIDAGCTWMLTMDQDSKFENGSIQILKNELQKCDEKNTGIISPFHNTVRANGIIPVGKEFPILVMTSGNMINLNSYTDVNGFDDDLFIDCVDFDYCLKLKRKGYNIIQINSSILQHELGDTIRKEMFGKIFFVDNHNYIRRYYIVRNRHYLFDKFHSDFPDYCNAEIRCTRKEVMKIILFEKNKFKKLLYMYRGYKDYKRGKVGKYEG